MTSGDQGYQALTDSRQENLEAGVANLELQSKFNSAGVFGEH